jgi:uncharacterized protein GlcG (DUF336 family)
VKQILTLDVADALKLVDLAIAASEAMQVPQNIAVVDAGGVLLAFHRMDGAKPYTVEFALSKARTAAGLRGFTENLAGVALPGQRGYGLNTMRGGDVAILGGGAPVTVEGVVVGAIGISSGTVHEDAEIAKKAVQEFEALAGQAQ